MFDADGKVNLESLTFDQLRSEYEKQFKVNPKNIYTKNDLVEALKDPAGHYAKRYAEDRAEDKEELEKLYRRW